MHNGERLLFHLTMRIFPEITVNKSRKINVKTTTKDVHQGIWNDL